MVTLGSSEDGCSPLATSAAATTLLSTSPNEKPPNEELILFARRTRRGEERESYTLNPEALQRKLIATTRNYPASPSTFFFVGPAIPWFRYVGISHPHHILKTPEMITRIGGHCERASHSDGLA